MLRHNRYQHDKYEFNVYFAFVSANLEHIVYFYQHVRFDRRPRVSIENPFIHFEYLTRRRDSYGNQIICWRSVSRFTFKRARGQVHIANSTQLYPMNSIVAESGKILRLF